MKSRAVPLVVVSALAVIFLLAPVSVRAECGEQGNEPCASAIYYTNLFQEPNWCLYQIGDRVFTRSTLVNSNMVAYEWYVVSGNDSYQGQLAYQYSQAGWSVDNYVVSGCQVIVLP